MRLVLWVLPMIRCLTILVNLTIFYLLATRNCDDFYALHQANSTHPGIIAIYRDAEVSKNMSYQGIVKAINNLELSEVDLANQFIILNQWQF